jgi:transposase
MKLYSADFRSKILETRKKNNESIQQLADLLASALRSRFGVSYSFVRQLVRRNEATGTVDPAPRGGGKPSVLEPAHIEIVMELVEEDNDATLEELGDRLLAKTGIRISTPTMCRVLQKLKLTRKKKTLHATEGESERV